MAFNRPALTRDQEQAVCTAYEPFRTTGDWPTHQYVDAHLQRMKLLPFWKLINDPKLPAGLLRWPLPYGEQERVKLTILGLSYCHKAQADIDVFLSALRWLVKQRADFAPSPTEFQNLEATAQDFRLHEFSLNAQPSEMELGKLFDLLLGEPLQLGGIPSQYSRGAWTVTIPPSILQFQGIETVDHYLARLQELYPPLEITPQNIHSDLLHSYRALAPTGLSPEVPAESASVLRRVFIVHGHDELARNETESYLRQLGIQPIVLQDQPNMGRTVIEKFEAFSDVDYAIVIMTPDDIAGRPAGEGQRARARQNVIFELGFFIGRLGRKKVCLLHKPDIEVPSDLHGVVYISLARNDWKSQLHRELVAAGFALDETNV